MPSLTNIQKRVKQRVRSSSNYLTIVYPAVRPVAAGVSPGTAPVNPLSGPPATEAVFPTDPAGYLPNVTVQCLWLDALTGREATDVPHTESWRHLQAGWVAGATAMARVLAEDVANDPTNPGGGTKLDAADHIEFNSTRYRILQVTPIGASFGPPYSYHVWLTGIRRT